MAQQPNVFKSSLTAGVIFGFVAGIPFIGAVNCLCCSLILGAGILSSYLQVKAAPTALTYGRAAAGGFFSGLFAIPIWLLTATAFSIILGNDFSSVWQDALSQASATSPEAQEVVAMLSSIGISVVIATLVAVSTLLYSTFGTLGGLLGRALFEKRAVPPTSAKIPDSQNPTTPAVGT